MGKVKQRKKGCGKLGSQIAVKSKGKGADKEKSKVRERRGI